MERVRRPYIPEKRGLPHVEAPCALGACRGKCESRLQMGHMDLGMAGMSLKERCTAPGRTCRSDRKLCSRSLKLGGWSDKSLTYLVLDICHYHDARCMLGC